MAGFTWEIHFSRHH